MSDVVVHEAVRAASAHLRAYAGFDEVHDGATELAKESILAFLDHLSQHYTSNVTLDYLRRVIECD